MHSHEFNTESFELSFFNESPFIDSAELESTKGYDDVEEEDEDAENDVDSSEERERMEKRIPTEAIYLGTLQNEVENWTTWENNDEYYLIKLQDSDFDWALFRLSWDDNWREWNFTGDAKLKSYDLASSIAARFLLEHVWSKWGIDYQRKGSPYQKMLQDIS